MGIFAVQSLFKRPMSICPCCSGKSFSQCCEPIINQQSAPTALALMRSRYTAYTLHLVDYLYETTHPRTRKNYSIHEIEKWAKESDWKKLEIVSLEHGKINDTRGIVEFKAFYTNQHGKSQLHHEKSNFAKQDGKWYYLDGLINPKPVDFSKKVSRNDPCPCGSGKKHKKCCGAA